MASHGCLVQLPSIISLQVDNTLEVAWKSTSPSPMRQNSSSIAQRVLWWLQPVGVLRHNPLLQNLAHVWQFPCNPCVLIFLVSFDLSTYSPRVLGIHLSIQVLQRDVVFDVDVIRKGVYSVSICGWKLGRIVCLHVRCGVVRASRVGCHRCEWYTRWLISIGESKSQYGVCLWRHGDKVKWKRHILRWLTGRIMVPVCL